MYLDKRRRHTAVKSRTRTWAIKHMGPSCYSFLSVICIYMIVELYDRGPGGSPFLDSLLAHLTAQQPYWADNYITITACFNDSKINIILVLNGCCFQVFSLWTVSQSRWAAPPLVWQKKTWTISGRWPHPSPWRTSPSTEVWEHRVFLTE